jgi:hypothetical protein
VIVARSGHTYRFEFFDSTGFKTVVYGVFQTASQDKRGNWYYFFDVEGEGVLAFHPADVKNLKEIE